MYASEDEGSGFFSPVAHRDPNMGHSSAADLLKVLLGDKGVPVGAQSLLVEVWIHKLGVGVLVHNFVKVVADVHL